MSVLQLKENFNSECQCHRYRIYDPWLFRSLLYNSGCSHCMYSRDVRPVALTLVSSATQKILAVQAGCCPQVAVALHV